MEQFQNEYVDIAHFLRVKRTLLKYGKYSLAEANGISVESIDAFENPLVCKYTATDMACIQTIYGLDEKDMLTAKDLIEDAKSIINVDMVRLSRNAWNKLAVVMKTMKNTDPLKWDEYRDVVTLDLKEVC